MSGAIDVPDSTKGHTKASTVVTNVEQEFAVGSTQYSVTERCGDQGAEIRESSSHFEFSFLTVKYAEQDAALYVVGYHMDPFQKT